MIHQIHVTGETEQNRLLCQTSMTYLSDTFNETQVQKDSNMRYRVLRRCHYRGGR